MKKLTTISLVVFSIVVTAILTAGLLSYQNNKTGQAQKNNLAQETLNQMNTAGEQVVLDIPEVSRHAIPSNCWIIIKGKVYNITSYFGSHPGGNENMAATCGKDATAAYTTKDPSASKSSSRSAHSSNAQDLLTNYYIGDVNQIIGKNVSANSGTASKVSTTQLPKENTTTNTLGGSVTLSMSEISRHSTAANCWFLISGKVYNITSYFGAHPGGNAPMAAMCGKDATAAYATKNPSATTSGGRLAHSSTAVSLLTNYYIGDLNQIIGEQKVIQTNSLPTPKNTGENEGEWDD